MESWLERKPWESNGPGYGCMKVTATPISFKLRRNSGGEQIKISALRREDGSLCEELEALIVRSLSKPIYGAKKYSTGSSDSAYTAEGVGSYE
jgi:hypothetical protein